MFVVDSDRLSVPEDRAINTIKLRPRLASHAPIVSNMRIVYGEFMWVNIIVIGTIIIIDSIIASRQNNDIRKCLC